MSLRLIVYGPGLSLLTASHGPGAGTESVTAARRAGRAAAKGAFKLLACRKPSESPYGTELKPSRMGPGPGPLVKPGSPPGPGRDRSVDIIGHG
jgi:hypothetical protein